MVKANEVINNYQQALGKGDFTAALYRSQPNPQPSGSFVSWLRQVVDENQIHLECRFYILCNFFASS